MNSINNQTTRPAGESSVGTIPIFRERIPQVPDHTVDVILDTDAFNEVDDQFALAYLILSPERANTVGITAAPFLNQKSSSPADGMQKSYDEICKVLRLMEREELIGCTYHGSEQYLPDGNTPVESEAARFLVEKAKAYSPEDPLYVVAIGAITNVASAILLDRETMVNNTVLIWLGGHSLDWPDTREFNMRQDIPAAQVVMSCGIPLVLLPCFGVVSAFRTTGWELKAWLENRNPVADYLYRNTVREAESYASGTAWSRCIWDVTAVAWLLNDREQYLKSRVIPTPYPEKDGTYSAPTDAPPCVYVYDVNRDAIFTDLFRKLTEKDQNM